MVGDGPRQEPRAPTGQPRARSGGGRSVLPGPGWDHGSAHPLCLSREGNFLFDLKIRAHGYISPQTDLAADFHKHTRPFRGEGRRGRERRRGGDKRDTVLCRVPPCRGLGGGGLPPPHSVGLGRGRGRGFHEPPNVNPDTLSIQISNKGPSADHNDFSKLLQV